MSGDWPTFGWGAVAAGLVLVMVWLRDRRPE